jgi:hypothetical protein
VLIKISALLNLAITAVYRSVIIKYIKRVFTSMETAVTSFRFICFIILADFVLKSTAF